MTNAEKQSQKYIKKINQRMAEVSSYVGFDSAEIANYKKALDLSGVDYEFKQTKTAPKGVFVIANTQENRQKAKALEKQIAKQKTETKGDIKQRYRKNVSEKKKKPKTEVTQEEIEQEREKSGAWNNLTSNLEILYRAQSDPKYSDILEEFTKQRDENAISDIKDGKMDEIVNRVNEAANQAKMEEEEYIQNLSRGIEVTRANERSEAEGAIKNFFKTGEYPF